MSLSVSVAGYGVFGKCVRISNASAELFVTVERGPRIIHFGLPGRENLLWADETGAGGITVPGLDRAYGRGDRYELTGGHRLWTSPEHEIRSYFPDTDPVEYEMTRDGCRLAAPPRPDTGLRHHMDIAMDPEGPALTVTVRVVNTSAAPVSFAPWAITQLAPGGVLVFPQPKRPTGLLPDRVMAVWPYTDMGDPRLSLRDDHICLRQDPENRRPIKLGMHGVPFALYHNRGAAFAKRPDAPLPDREYPDFGCSFEAYANHLFLEMETLGPLETVPPGGAASHTERWSVHPLEESLSPEALLARFAGAFAETPGASDSAI